MATIKAVSVFQSIKEAFKLDHQIRPPRLTHPGFPIVLRPLTMDDEDGWNEVRWRNNDWLAPWESGDPMHGGSITFNQWVQRQRRNEQHGVGVIFAIEYQMRIVGQISLGAIVYGAMRTGVVGYWVDQRCAGRGFAPMALAMLADWALGDPFGPALHRWKSPFCRIMRVLWLWCVRSEPIMRDCASGICMSMASGVTT